MKTPMSTVPLGRRKRADEIAEHIERAISTGEFKEGSFVGATPLMWCGFDLKPRNLWDRSPYYP